MSEIAENDSVRWD